MNGVASLVLEQLQIGLANLRTPNPEAKNVDRLAEVDHLPVKYLREFRRMSKAQAQNLLEFVEAWLARRNAPGSDEPTTKVTVHAYAQVGSVD